MPVRLIVLTSILFAAVLGLACDNNGPTTPSRTPSAAEPPAPSPGPAPGPAPGPDLSALVGAWNLMVRVTGVTGSGCIAETMRSQIGVPKPYSLSITQTNYTVTVNLKSASGDYACTFTPVVDSSGFTTYGKGGYYTCEQQFVPVSCADGTMHGIVSYGEDISGQLSGTELKGAWDAWWSERLLASGFDVEMKAEYTGSRSTGSPVKVFTLTNRTTTRSP